MSIKSRMEKGKYIWLKLNLVCIPIYTYHCLSLKWDMSFFARNTSNQTTCITCKTGRDTLRIQIRYLSESSPNPCLLKNINSIFLSETMDVPVEEVGSDYSDDYSDWNQVKWTEKHVSWSVLRKMLIVKIGLDWTNNNTTTTTTMYLVKLGKMVAGLGDLWDK